MRAKTQARHPPDNMLVEMTNNGYDEIAYDTVPQIQGNIRLLETVADLYEKEPIDIRRCRVLELGTATGKTIIPQAEEFAESEFIGIDLSQRQIDDGRRLVDELGLKNIRLRCANILDVGPDWGAFDYMIVHGIYSWVPQGVQEKILDICRENLSPNGVAMISYNTYPGWNFKETIRNLMLYHVRIANSFENGDAEVREAKNVLGRLAEIKSRQNGYDAPFYAQMQRLLAGEENSYVYHEFLEDENNPCYFAEFQRRLQTCGLTHLSDVDWRYVGVCLQQKNIGDFLRDVKSQRDIEQYVDFFVNRSFRSSIVCRATKTEDVHFRQDLSRRYAMRLPEAVEIVRADDAGWMLRLSDPGSVSVSFRLTASPFHDTIVRYFAANRPEWFTLIQLDNEFRYENAFDRNALESMLSTLIRLGILKIALHPAASPSRMPERPTVRGFARALAKRNQSVVPTPDFEFLRLDSLRKTLLPLLDGTRTVAEIVDESRRPADAVHHVLEELRRLRLVDVR